MRRSLALMAIAVLSALSLTACFSGDEPQQCFLANVGSTPTPIPCDSPSIIGTSTTSSLRPTVTSTTRTTTSSTTASTAATTTTTVPTTTTPSPTTTTTTASPTPTTTTTQTVVRTLYSTGNKVRCGGSQLSGPDDRVNLNGNDVRFVILNGVPTIAFAATPSQYLPVSRFIVSGPSLRAETGDDFKGAEVSISSSDIGLGDGQNRVFSIVSELSDVDRLTICE